MENKRKHKHITLKRRRKRNRQAGTWCTNSTKARSEVVNEDDRENRNTHGRGRDSAWESLLKNNRRIKT